MTRIAARPALGEAAAAPGTAGGGGGDGGGERAGGGEGGASASPGRGAGGSTATPPPPPRRPSGPGGRRRPAASPFHGGGSPPTAAPGSTAAGPALGAGGDAAVGAASRAATRAHGSPGPVRRSLRAPRSPGPAGSARAFTYKAPCAAGGPAPSLPTSSFFPPSPLASPRHPTRGSRGRAAPLPCPAPGRGAPGGERAGSGAGVPWAPLRGVSALQALLSSSEPGGGHAQLARGGPRQGAWKLGAASRPVGACTWRHVEVVWLWPAMAQRLGTETALRDSVPCMHLESGDAALFTCEGNSDAGMLRCCLSSANKSPVLTFYYYFLNIINEQSFPRRLVSFLKAWKKTEVCNLDSN